MKNKYDAYEQDFQLNDKLNIAKELIEKVNVEEKKVEDEPELLKELIDMDLRENVPPQIYELISCVVEMIDKVEKG